MLAVLAAGLAGCGKSKSPSATATFCNNLVLKSGGDFQGYLSFTADGVNDTWYAWSGECTACTGIAAGKTLRFEFGDESDWIYQFSYTLEIGGEYKFKAEIDTDTSLPAINVYVPKSGYSCEDINNTP